MPPETVKNYLSRMSGKLSRTVLRRGKGSNPFSLVDYTSGNFRRLLKQHKAIHSNSRKGNPYDNAMMESLYRTLKRELILDARFETPEQAQMEVFKYIELYYNTKRMHSALGYISPAQFERENS